MSEVKVFKMSNGDEVIARVDGDTISRPRIIFHDGSQGGLAPYFLTNPDADEVPFNRAFVVSEFAPSPDVEKSYVQLTSRVQLLS